MIDDTASRTALATAWLRAAHQLLDAPPLVLDDPVAVPLLGPDAPQRIHAMEERMRQPPAAMLRAHMVLRARYAEDRLAQAVQRGVAQFVLLGAGLDTFALRQPPWAHSLRIIEIDHPATQAHKRRLIDEAGLAVPGNTLFADVDFERESLAQGLARHGITPQLPTFFSWLGVTMYLQEAAIDAVLRTCAGFAPGSEMVLTFLQPPDGSPESARLADLVASVGEPFVSTFAPDALRDKLLATGWTETGFLDVEQSRSRYFDQRPADLPVPQSTALAYALR